MYDHLDAVKTAIVAALTALGAFLGWKGVLVMAWVFLMAIDYISGTCAAMKAGEWSSKRAREGAWHKGGAILVVLVAGIADVILLVICGNIPVLEIVWPGWILPLVLAWYIITEFGSIVENAIKLGANPPAWLSRLLLSTLHAVDTVGDAVADELDKE